MIQNDADKPSPEELVHYGVKGMKWGHRKRVTSADIRAARSRVRRQESALGRAEDAMTNPNTGKVNRTAAKNFKQLETQFHKTPDRATALRLTTGEKFILAALGPVGVGAAAGQLASRKLTERSIKKNGG